MKIHEYQSKDIFSSYGIPVQDYRLCYTPEEAADAYDELGGGLVVIKSQVLTGGRGKAGGVKLANSKSEALIHADAILKLTIKGFPVTKITVNKAVDIASEYYLSFIKEINTTSVVRIMSAAGGMDIEEVAKNRPEKIHKFSIDQLIGLPH